MSLGKSARFRHCHGLVPFMCVLVCVCARARACVCVTKSCCNINCNLIIWHFFLNDYFALLVIFLRSCMNNFKFICIAYSMLVIN